MSTQHTNGAIRYEYEPGYCGELIARDGMTVAAFVNEPSEADARRLVACWSACDGLQTDLLESIAMMGDTLASRFKLRDKTERELQAQRDALLAKLKVLTRSLSYEELMRDDQRDAFKQAIAAIAKAEGRKK